MGRFAAGAALAVFATALLSVPLAHADPPPSGCQRDVLFGLNPQVREVCDLDIQPDGSWTRWRWFSHPEDVHSTCGQNGSFVGGQYYCPPWAPKETIPAEQTPVEKYVVTPDTIPPGEPGHIDS